MKTITKLSLLLFALMMLLILSFICGFIVLHTKHVILACVIWGIGICIGIIIPTVIKEYNIEYKINKILKETKKRK